MRIIEGLGKLLVASVMAGVLLAGLLLPYSMGLGLTANKVTDAIESADTTLLDMSKVPLRTTITDNDGTVIGYVYDQNRVKVPLSEISLNLQRAVISVEDRRFKIHHGVDWQGTLRALLQNAAGDPISGGSTITQQLVKNYLYLVKAKTPAEKAAAIARTPVRKLREAKIALMYEKSHTKDQILEEYLNLVAFGPNTYGAEAGAQRFFGVHADRLSLSQAALMAAMINNPNKYNPLVGSQVDVTLERRNQVLDDMYRDGWISAKARDTAKAISIAQDLNASRVPDGCIGADNAATNGYFCRYVLDYLEDAGMDYQDIARGGFTITSTMDPAVMKNAAAAVRKTVSPDDPKADRIANVMAVIEPGVGTRKVLALAANRPYGLDADKGETVQRLTTTFAPLGAGGVFKLFTAAAALDQGLGINSEVPVPKEYQSPLAPQYTFTNGKNASWPESMTLTQALAQQPDTPFVKLEDQVGLGAVVNMSVALGLRGYTLDAGDVSRAYPDSGMTFQELVPAEKIPSYTLGTTPVSPTELANVGATLDSDGVWCPPTPVASITDRNGNQVTWKQDSCEQAVPPELAHTLTNALTKTMHEKKGTGYPAAHEAGWTRNSAAMTGTRTRYRSAAFLGYTPYYSAATMTWDYLSHPQPICVDPVRQCTLKEAEGGAGMTGGSVPENTWLAAMIPLHDGAADTPFPVSDPRYLVGTSGAQLPDTVGLSLTDALAMLSAHGFNDVDWTYDSDTTLPADTVVTQDPEHSALPGTKVTLTVSPGLSTSGQTNTVPEDTGDTGTAFNGGDETGGSGGGAGGSGGGAAGDGSGGGGG